MVEEEKAALAARLMQEKSLVEEEKLALAARLAAEKAELASQLDRESSAHEREKAKLAAKMAEERATLTAQVWCATHKIAPRVTESIFCLLPETGDRTLLSTKLNVRTRGGGMRS